ncbi:hypothetical protein [Saccharothrix australiensis]|uniref:Platelet-activating factor acetylhydrolase n=1 Tax=Saccharothrix australiensis TaxID=2072 RepID=A0A495W2P3_9PSEU|nr:hypothetical protein [Saccharothrix australiensis]RKT55015.1 hypothetical protein C8E97_3671 [Saccharothrix australiensis]
MDTTVSRRRLFAGGAALAATTLLPGVAAARGAPADTAARGRPPRPRLPAPTGPFTVGTTTAHLVDRARPDPYVPAQPYRELAVGISYPAGGPARQPVAPWLTPGWARESATVMQGIMGELSPGLVDWAGARSHSRVDAPAHPAAGPVVLVVLGHWFSHGALRTVIEGLAARGYVVVACDPTFETPVEFPGGRLVPPHPGALPPAGEEPGSPAFLAYIRGLYRGRVADARFVLDAVADAPGLPPGLRAVLRTDRVGVVGGGTGAGLACLQLAHDDPRVAAVAVGDLRVGWPTADGPVPIAAVTEHGLDRPVLAVHPGATDRDPLWERQWAVLRGWRRELELRDGGHAWLTDFQTVLPDVARGLGLPGDHFASAIGGAHPPGVVAARRAYLSAFFDLHLRGRDHGLLDGPSPRHRQIRFVR